MSISIKPETIKEIADELEMGFLVFYHLEHEDFIAYPDELKHSNFEAADWKSEISSVKKGRKKYIKFEPMDTGQEVRMMHGFVSQIENKKTREDFEEAINNRKSFQAFKHLLRQDEDLQQSWYLFKTNHYIQWVNEQLEVFNLKN